MSVTLTKELDKYKDRVRNLDDRAEHLAREKKLQYEAEKHKFMSRLDAWQQSIENDLSTLKKNVEDGYHRLESKIL